jgi:arylsulfatase A-like enzyme
VGHRVFTACLIAGSLVWATGCGDAGRPSDAAAPAADRPNVLVIMWDTVRPDHLGPYGYAKPTTPFLDRLAGESIVFDNALSTTCWTVPSHASLFTGLLPSAHGTYGSDGWLDDGYETLAETLSATGYETFLFSANPFVSKSTNMIQGFETVEHPWEEPWRSEVLSDAASEALRGASFERRKFKEAGAVISRAVLDWLDVRERDNAGEPFFAFLNYMEAHFPYFSTPAERRALMHPALVRHSRRMQHDYLTRQAVTLGVKSLSELDQRAIAGIYDTSVRKLDRVTHELVEGLRQRGLLEDTVVVIVSDHGESLGDHGMLGHEYSLYGSLTRIAMIARYPRQWQPGSRSSAPVQIQDLHATLLNLTEAARPDVPEYAGIDLSDPAAMEATPRPRLMEYLRPKTAHIDSVERAFPGQVDRARWMRKLRALQRGPWKVIWVEGGAHELYDLSEDPGETKNLFSEHEDRAREMLEEMEAFVERSEQVHEKFAEGGRPALEADPEQLERLRSLGYIGDPGGDS